MSRAPAVLVPRAAPAVALDPIFPVPGAAGEGEYAVPVFEGFHYGSQGMRSFGLREGDNPQ